MINEYRLAQKEANIRVKISGIGDEGSGGISNNRGTSVNGRRNIYRATGTRGRRPLNISSDGCSSNTKSRGNNVVRTDLCRDGQQNGDGAENFGEHD